MSCEPFVLRKTQVVVIFFLLIMYAAREWWANNETELIMTKIIKLVAVLGLAALSVVGASAMTNANSGAAHWSINAGAAR